MTQEDNATDDLHRVAWTPLSKLSGESSWFDRFDYGDAAQRAEMEGVEEALPDEPLEMVDAPIQIRQPYPHSGKTHDQRPLRT